MLTKVVLDTSVLIYDYEALFNFKDSEVIVPYVVFEELDRMKTEATERGYAARIVMGYLEELSLVGALSKSGVSLESVSINSPIYPLLKYKTSKVTLSYHTKHAAVQSPNVRDCNDLSIIACAYNHGAKLYSRDRGMRTIARNFVKAEDYILDVVKKQEIYKGYREVIVPPNAIEKLYAGTLEDIWNLHANEFVILVSECNDKHTSIGIKKKNGIIPCNLDKIENRKRKVTPLNLEQKLLAYLLMDESITCVSVTGVSGKGKSLMAVDYALSQTECGFFNKFLYSKPSVPVEQAEYLGFNKGTLEEKLKPHLKPLYSSIEYLYKKELYGAEKRKSVDEKMDELISRDIVEFLPLADIRGMNVFSKVIILDEAQNTTKHMMKSFITRMTDTSKVIVLGDVEQIDDHHLDKHHNGLVHLIESAKDEYMIGHLTMDIESGSRRGKLAEFGTKML